QIEVTEGANSTISSGFQLAAGSTNSVEAVAYTMTIKGSSLVNTNLSRSSDPVVLNMSVSEAWVNAHGGISAIKIIRYSDDGVTKEVLETQHLFTAGTPAMCYFKVISPHGCSVFGVASVVAVPQSSPGSGSASSSGNYYGHSHLSTVSKASQEQKAPLQPSGQEQVVPKEPHQQPQPGPAFNAPLETVEEGNEIPLAGAAERELSKSLMSTLAFIGENILAVAGGGSSHNNLCRFPGLAQAQATILEIVRISFGDSMQIPVTPGAGISQSLPLVRRAIPACAAR
ncbi:MAG TPA: hypothetical protein VHN82_03115, partial [Methanoregula sp.]|nr:hypothetical protein [Methanoregula sp.]